MVQGHDSRLGQVVNNLIDNARSFSPPNGRVRIACRAFGGQPFDIVVEDDGPGIRPDAMDRIFERFYTDRPQQNFGQNSGLGLSISKQIVEAHGGRLSVREPHRGTSEAGEAAVLGARLRRRASGHVTVSDEVQPFTLSRCWSARVGFTHSRPLGGRQVAVGARTHSGGGGAGPGCHYSRVSSAMIASTWRRLTAVCWYARRPSLAGLIEVRGLGIVACPMNRSAVVSLVVDLATAERIRRPHAGTGGGPRLAGHRARTHIAGAGLLLAAGSSLPTVLAAVTSQVAVPVGGAARPAGRMPPPRRGGDARSHRHRKSACARPWDGHDRTTFVRRTHRVRRVIQ